MGHHASILLRDGSSPRRRKLSPRPLARHARSARGRRSDARQHPRRRAVHEDTREHVPFLPVRGESGADDRRDPGESRKSSVHLMVEATLPVGSDVLAGSYDFSASSIARLDNRSASLFPGGCGLNVTSRAPSSAARAASGWRPGFDLVFPRICLTSSSESARCARRAGRCRRPTSRRPAGRCTWRRCWSRFRAVRKAPGSDSRPDLRCGRRPAGPGLPRAPPSI